MLPLLSISSCSQRKLYFVIKRIFFKLKTIKRDSLLSYNPFHCSIASYFKFLMKLKLFLPIHSDKKLFAAIEEISSLIFRRKEEKRVNWAKIKKKRFKKFWLFSQRLRRKIRENIFCLRCDGFARDSSRFWNKVLISIKV